MRVLSAAAALTMLAGTAMANPLTFTYTSYSVLNLQPITISGPATNPPFNKLVGAGEITLYDGPAEHPIASLIAWCLDPLHVPFLFPSGTYTIEPLSAAVPNPPDVPLTHEQQGEVGALMAYGLKHADDNPFESAAIQEAIWRVALGPEGYTFTDLSTPMVNADANTLLAELPSLPLDFDWSALIERGNQRLGTLSVNEPGDLALLAAGLFVLGVGLGLKRVYPS